ncbi:HD domain-containing phosphohydrolase [Chitinilyticum litopenaei]|uniref:HD domain-containing phosphohydrolase n=1 Tax=Chitinilyticum litopenaei TaxID=1121276 RepID=UPI00048C122E|nr:HD domain-containing phosphohydrolase [Chitinilyticum litopenaei]
MTIPPRKPHPIPLYIHISYLFIGLLLIYAIATGWYQFRQTSQLLTDNAKGRFEQIARLTASEVQSAYFPALTTAQLLAKQRLMYAETVEQRLDSLGFLVTAIERQPAVSSLYMGYDNGDFFMLRPYRDEPVFRDMFKPPAGTRWIVQSIASQGEQRVGEYLFFDASLTQLDRRPAAEYRYDPRQRSWFQGATARTSPLVTPPYYFFTSKAVGVTFAMRTDNHAGVAGVDIELHALGKLLQELRMTPNSSLALLGPSGSILASHLGEAQIARAADGKVRLKTLAESGAAELRALHPQTAMPANQSFAFHSDGGNWLAMRTEMPLLDGHTLQLLMATPEAELLAEAIRIRNRGIIIMLISITLGLLQALWFARLAAHPLDALSGEVQKIERFQFEERIELKSHITEVARLGNALGSMKDTIRRFMELSQALASETNFSRLVSLLLSEMQATTQAAGGAIYLLKADHATLEGAGARWDGQELVLAQEIRLDADHLLAAELQRNHHTTTLSASDLAQAFPWLPPLDDPHTLLTLPLKSRDGELLGVLALLVDEHQHPLGPDLLAFAEALSTTAATALYTQRLINEQKILLEAFIQLIAGAIDAKSPYTGGHCQRVPELTKMLARAACRQSEGPFADFRLSEEQWEELHIAAWLHDCGKVTTPEYVVDKATKLETLYDRIHEVRMRFEVLKRDAEIACLKAIAAGGDAATLQASLDSTLAALDEEFAFIATCNEGGEFMAPEKVDRLRAIAARTWQRTLSDRIGISHEEKERKATTPEPALPVTETLLADKPEHIIARGNSDYLQPGNPWGFRVDVPEHLYNRGELYNLAVGRGTLSEEERFKINEHIIQTIIMLEKLPFPRHLQHVPEIAGGHHEKMDGKGYPKRLTRAEMSAPARMMAIADIFEALTAIDRPYKKGKTLSEAIKIMGFMKKDQHIDPELFELFLREGVYLEYARRYMRPEQIDEVDIVSLLGQ